jgi:uncharacterized membrane protein YgaE (UPF0421/DUF939 family)
MLKKFIPNPLYLLKCLIGVLICYVFYVEIPAYPFVWAVVSVVIAISPDNSNKQAYDRITANLIGCAVGLALFPIPLPVWLELCLGIVLTIVIGSALKKTEALRSALAAVVIVLLNERENRQWYLPLERVVCVVAGCVVALLVTLLFTLIARYRWSRRS